MCENGVFFYPCKIATHLSVTPQAAWATWHTNLCLDMIPNLSVVIYTEYLQTGVATHVSLLLSYMSPIVQSLFLHLLMFFLKTNKK